MPAINAFSHLYENLENSNDLKKSFDEYMVKYDSIRSKVHENELGPYMELRNILLAAFEDAFKKETGDYCTKFASRPKWQFMGLLLSHVDKSSGTFAHYEFTVHLLKRVWN